MKHLFSILLALVAGVSLMHASTTQVDGIWYDFDDENHTAEVTANPNKYTGDVIIPASVEYDSVIYSVTSIDWKAFNNCTEMTSCVIPNSVTSFVAYTFWGCNALQTINIPASVENIIRLDEGVGFLTHATEGHGDDGFMISALTAINVDAQNPNYASIDGVLFNKELTTLIEYPSGRLGDYIVPNSVDSIGNYAFYGCHNISEITLPGTLRSIGMVAFGMSYVTDINMPEGLKYIGLGAVCGCPNLHSISLPSTLEIIEESAFAASSNIDTIYNYATTPQAIDVSVFEGISKEQCLLLVPSQSLAAYQAANGWSQFTNIQGMDTATTPTCPVASGTCGENLTWELGCDSVLTISGNGAMNDFSSPLYAPWNQLQEKIKSVEIQVGITTIGARAFTNMANIETIALPEGLLSIGNYAFLKCSGLTDIVLPSSVDSIGTGAFNGCSGLTQMTVPNHVTKLGDGIFEECTGLTQPVYNNNYFLYMPTQYTGSYTVPTGIIDIKGSAFSQCRGITEIILPEGLQRISNTAFALCTGLQQITFPTSLVSIGENAFCYCNNLSSIYIPANVSSIGLLAFAVHITEDYSAILPFIQTNLTHIDVDPENPYFTSVDGVVYDKEVKRLLFYPAGKEGYDIPYGVEEIGPFAFYGNMSVTHLSFPQTVTKIDEWAFGYCANLTSLELPSSLTSIGVYALGALTLHEITCLAVVPPTVDAPQITGDHSIGYGYGFDTEGNSFMQALYVPAGSVEAYRTDPEWGKIRDIRALEEQPTLINPVQINGMYFTLDYENHTAEVTANPNKYTGDVIIPASVEYDSVIYSVTSIDWKAFNSCTEMTSCVIPNSVTSLVAAAFWGCNALQTINIPASVENIIRLDEGAGFLTHVTEGHGDDGFMISALTAINVDAQNPNYASIDGVLFNKELTTLIEYPSGRLGDYIVPNSVDSIGNYAFYGCHNISEITLPGTLRSIGMVAFGMSYVTDINMPEGLKYIGLGAVCACPNLHSISLPSTLEIIEESAFAASSNIDTIYNYATTPQAIDVSVFEGISKEQCLLLVPSQSLAAYQASNGWSQFTTILPIEEEVEMYSWQVESNDIVMGIVSTTLNAGVYQYGTQITVEALSNSGYKFVKWNDGKKYNPYTFSLVDNKYLMAIFMAEEVEPDTVVVQPTETTVTITWPSVENSYTYSLIIYLDEECTIEYCTITFNENGQVIHINFAQQAPSRQRRQQNDFSYTIPGLSANTTYYYKIEAKDEDGKLLNTDEGSFQTEEDTSSAIEMTETTSTTLCKILVNGQVFILRADKTYTIDGQEVK